MNIIPSFDPGKTTVVLACAMGLATVCFSGISVEAQTLADCDGGSAVEEIVSGQEVLEIVLESSVIEQQRIEKSEHLSHKFQGLAEQWRNERGAQPTVAAMALLPSYQKIIGMGKDALPLILAELKSEGDAPDHWFWALAAISDENPVPPESRGKLLEMAKSWLAWGQKNGHVQMD